MNGLAPLPMTDVTGDSGDVLTSIRRLIAQQDHASQNTSARHLASVAARSFAVRDEVPLWLGRDERVCGPVAGTMPPDSKEPEMNMLTDTPTPVAPLAEVVAARPTDFDLFAAPQDDEPRLDSGHALRNLVRDVIRQELEGELGARISQNVRRVVRQEVVAAINASLKL